MRKIQFEDITSLVNQVLEESGRSRRNEFSPRERFRQDLDFDSLDLAVFAVKLEAIAGIDVFELGLLENLEQVLDRANRK